MGGRGVGGYIQEQRQWIGDYAAWQEAGYPVGSGMVEQAVELVINRRLKCHGGRWWRGNADAVVVLRVQRVNEDRQAQGDLLHPAA